MQCIFASRIINHSYLMDCSFVNGLGGKESTQIMTSYRLYFQMMVSLNTMSIRRKFLTQLSVTSESFIPGSLNLTFSLRFRLQFYLIKPNTSLNVSLMKYLFFQSTCYKWFGITMVFCPRCILVDGRNWRNTISCISVFRMVFVRRNSQRFFGGMSISWTNEGSLCVIVFSIILILPPNKDHNTC